MNEKIKDGSYHLAFNSFQTATENISYYLESYLNTWVIGILVQH